MNSIEFLFFRFPPAGVSSGANGALTFGGLEITFGGASLTF